MFPRFKRDDLVTNLRHAAAKGGAEFGQQPFFGYRASCNRGCRQACRRPATAARIAQAVFVQVAVVGVAGTKGLQDVSVVLAALVGISYQQANRRAGGLAW